MDSLQGIPVEYKLDTFNMPRTGTTLCHPKIGYVDPTCNPALDTLALNSPLDHINGDQRTPSPQVTRHTKLHGNSKVQFLQLQHVFRQNATNTIPDTPDDTLPSQPSQHLITQFRLNTHKLKHHESCSTKSNQYSMLQIKTYF